MSQNVEIHYKDQATTPASSCSSCNYENNYYGDRVCRSQVKANDQTLQK